jgi:hypothetical protein
MINGKLKLYNEFAGELVGIEDRAVKKFIDYYINSYKKFKVNPDFNFIPKMMLDSSSMFYNRMITNGYRNTEVGLYMAGSQPKSVIDFKE